MNPIFTCSNERGISGYQYVDFVQHFDSICKDHLNTGRASKFAFIIYDFHSATHKVLQNQGVFTELDRLSGKMITIYYLDGQLNEKFNSQNKLYQNLNQIFTELTNQHIHSIPFIVFFEFAEGDVTSLKCYSIRNDEIFILNDLTNAITKELHSLTKVKSEKDTSGIISLIGETPKIIYTEFIKLIFNGIFKPER